MFWNKTITLYNRYENEKSGIIEWYRHKIDRCFYKRTNNTANVGGGQIKTDDNIIRIPAQSKYLPPYEWAKLPSEQKSEFLTLQSGDLIFLSDINVDIDEYTPGKRSSDIITEYKSIGSVFIKAVNINDFLYGQHYLVRGE